MPIITIPTNKNMKFELKKETERDGIEDHSKKNGKFNLPDDSRGREERRESRLGEGREGRERSCRSNLLWSDWRRRRGRWCWWWLCLKWSDGLCRRRPFRPLLLRVERPRLSSLEKKTTSSCSPLRSNASALPFLSLSLDLYLQVQLLGDIGFS